MSTTSHPPAAAPANLWATSRGTARTVRRSAGAWDLRTDDLDLVDKSDETRFPELIGFALFGFPVLALAGLPVNELTAGLLCVLALTRPANAAVSAALLTYLPAVLAAYLLVTSLANDLIDERRLLHIALWTVLAYVLATGRIHLPSAARGAAIGLSVSVVLSAAGVSNAGYTGRLSGTIGDPNAAGYILTVIGFVALSATSTKRLRNALLLVIPLAVVLTFSRTTLLALAFSVVWLLVGRRLGRITGLAVVGAMIYAVTHIPDQLRLFGPFSDRTGSDDLRDRLIAQEHLDVDLNKWTGAGAGTAHVDLEGNNFFYHSSYLALQREGGLLALMILVGLVVLIALALLGQPPAARNLWVECSLICLMVCAINLGEVLIELPAAVAIGVALHHLRTTPRGTHAAPVAPALRVVRG